MSVVEVIQDCLQGRIQGRILRIKVKAKRMFGDVLEKQIIHRWEMGMKELQKQRESYFEFLSKLIFIDFKMNVYFTF